MTETENYLSRVRSERYIRVLRSFIGSITLFSLTVLAAYLFFSNVSCGHYVITADIASSGFVGAVRAALSASVPCAVVLTVIYLTAYTTMGSAVASLIAVWKGLCSGSVLGLHVSGSLGVIGSGNDAALWLYFAQSGVICLLCAVTSLYRAGLIYASASAERQYSRSLTVEYTKVFLVFSGVIFVLGFASFSLL